MAGPLGRRSLPRGGALVLLLSGLLALLAACAPGPWTVRVEDRSMEPTLVPRELVTVRPAATVRYGDVIAFAYPFPAPERSRHVLISRVIGLPGDRIEIVAGRVLRNGAPLDEPYVRNRSDRSFPPVIVPPGHYYVLGDDRTNQRDSRYWGPLPADRLLGVVALDRPSRP